MNNETAITSFLEIGCTYRVTFNQHSAESILQSVNKAKVKDIDKLVNRKEGGKMPRCLLLIFDGWRSIINCEDIQGVKIIPNGIVICMDYALEIVKV